MTRHDKIAVPTFLLFVALLSSPLSAEPTDTGIADPTLARVLFDHAPPPRVQTELTVSSSDDHRAVVTGICEAEGEVALERLARSSTLEDAFAYVPQLCTWIDIGLQQTPSSVRIDRRMLDDLAMEFGRIVIYHIHPLQTDGPALYFPAYSDLLGVILINAKHRPHRAVEILHRVVTPIGVVDYFYRPSALAEEMMAVIERTGLTDFAGENLSMAYRTRRHESLYRDAIRDCTETGVKAERFVGCFPLVAGDFYLEHRTVGP